MWHDGQAQAGGKMDRHKHVARWTGTNMWLGGQAQTCGKADRHKHVARRTGTNMWQGGQAQTQAGRGYNFEVRHPRCVLQIS
jgi:hypothetical protein